VRRHRSRGLVVDPQGERRWPAYGTGVRMNLLIAIPRLLNRVGSGKQVRGPGGSRIAQDRSSAGLDLLERDAPVPPIERDVLAGSVGRGRDGDDDAAGWAVRTNREDLRQPGDRLTMKNDVTEAQ